MMFSTCISSMIDEVEKIEFIKSGGAVANIALQTIMALKARTVIAFVGRHRGNPFF